jgi:hypothetical protein
MERGETGRADERVRGRTSRGVFASSASAVLTTISFASGAKAAHLRSDNARITRAGLRQPTGRAPDLVPETRLSALQAVPVCDAVAVMAPIPLIRADCAIVDPVEMKLVWNPSRWSRGALVAWICGSWSGR